MDVGAQRKSLDNDFGSTAGPHTPASHEVALYVDDPRAEGAEVSGPGYGRVTLLPADWAPADESGVKTPVASVVFPAPAGEWSTAAWWGLVGADGLLWASAVLADPCVVTGPADEGPHLDLAIFYNESMED